MKCIICKNKLDCTEEGDFQEAFDFDTSIKPLCDECYNREDKHPEDIDYEQYSDADPGL